MTILPATATDSDHALLTRWQGGEEDALAQLVQRHAGLVHRSCRRQLGAADADDAAQAVFLILAQKAKRAAAATVLEAWLLGVARRVCANAARARRRRLRHEQESAAMDAHTHHAGETPSDLSSALARDLDAALAALPSQERDAVSAHYLGGLSHAELALRYRCQEVTIRVRVHRGMQRLRTWFGKRGHGVATVVLLAALLSERGAAAAEAVAATAKLLVGLPDPTPTGSGALAAPSARAQAWSQATMREFSMIRTLPYAAGLGLVALLGASWCAFAADGANVESPPPSAPAPLPTAQFSVTYPPEAPLGIPDMVAMLIEPVSQVVVLDLPTLHVVAGIRAYSMQEDPPSGIVLIVTSSEPALSRAHLEAAARADGRMQAMGTFGFAAELIARRPLWIVESQEHAAAAQQGRAGEPARWVEDGPGLSYRKDGVVSAQLRWLPGGQGFRISSTAWADQPPMSWSAHCRTALQAMPGSAWFKTVTRPLPPGAGADVTGVMPISGWIDSAEHGGRYEFLFDMPQEMVGKSTAFMRALVPDFLFMSDRLNQDIHAELAEVPADERPARQNALQDLVYAVNMAVMTLQVTEATGAVRFSGTTDSDTIERTFLKAIQ